MTNELIFEYHKASDEEKEKFFVEQIEPGFRLLIENILSQKTFTRFNFEYDKEGLIEDAIDFLLTRIDRFKKVNYSNGKPAQAYSYFSTIIKCFCFGRLYKEAK